MHTPVLLQETIAGLAPQPGETVIDGTVGSGGHAALLAHAIGAGGRLLGLDRDTAALARAARALAAAPAPVTLREGSFADLETIAPAAGFSTADVILLDLGFSSEQMDESGRGFSVHRDEPLQMTLGDDPTRYPFTAADIVNEWTEDQLETILRNYGEERFAGPIAAAIVAARVREPLRTTADLVRVIGTAVPAWYQHRRIHYATKTFQALRLTVNDELDVLRRGLAAAWALLSPGGRLGIISFHSLESRIVKQFFQTQKRAGTGRLWRSHALKPTRAEVLTNRRSRSAELRIIIKSPLSS